jgi:pimeloyl-ACP methyl ester carboxylesterase
MRFPLLTWMVSALLAACAASPVHGISAGPAPPAAWADPSPHQVRFATVAEGVRLEVLDWGGEGPPLVFLTGLGDSAHVFDDFAPALRDRFHVYAVTRRGFGASSQPKSGYDVATLGADLRGVLREIGVKSASFVGHSIAGEELTWLAVNAPECVDKIVYLDAAYDRAARREVAHDAPQLPPLPDPTDADKASIAAYGAYLERSDGVRVPEADVRATSVFDASGRYSGSRAPDEIEGAVVAGTLHPEYPRITAPALAIYAVFDTPESLVPASPWSALSAADREKVRIRFAYRTPIAAADRERFRREVTHGAVVEIHGANHYVYLSHREVVSREIREFLGASSPERSPSSAEQPK